MIHFVFGGTDSFRDFVIGDLELSLDLARGGGDISWLKAAWIRFILVYVFKNSKLCDIFF